MNCAGLRTCRTRFSYTSGRFYIRRRTCSRWNTIDAKFAHSSDHQYSAPCQPLCRKNAKSTRYLTRATPTSLLCALFAGENSLHGWNQWPRCISIEFLAPILPLLQLKLPPSLTYEHALQDLPLPPTYLTVYKVFFKRYRKLSKALWAPPSSYCSKRNDWNPPLKATNLALVADSGIHSMDPYLQLVSSACRIFLRQDTSSYVNLNDHNLRKKANESKWITTDVEQHEKMAISRLGRNCSEE